MKMGRTLPAAIQLLVFMLFAAAPCLSAQQSSSVININVPALSRP